VGIVGGYWLCCYAASIHYTFCSLYQISSFCPISERPIKASRFQGRFNSACDSIELSSKVGSMETEQLFGTKGVSRGSGGCTWQVMFAAARGVLVIGGIEVPPARVRQSHGRPGSLPHIPTLRLDGKDIILLRIMPVTKFCTK
jgi:hypothetical protein